ncbi:MAG: tyrosine-type recombinase/integrase [Candidatus Baltobacteraceae bacterium]
MLYQSKKSRQKARASGLRHSFATIALGARIPMKIVSEMLGHTTTAITADIHTHVIDDMQQAAADQIGEAFRLHRLR